MSNSDPLASAVAAHGLPGAPIQLCDQPLPPRQWDALLGRVWDERLAAMLVRAVDDGALVTTPGQTEEATAMHRASLYRVIALEALLLDVIDLFAGAGIDCRALKGSAVAHLDYPDPSLRLFIDADVLVTSDQFDHAAAVLEDAGFTRLSPQLREGFDRRFGKGTTLASPDGLELDLHRTLDRGPFGLAVRLPELWAGWSSFRLAGREVFTLAPEQRFLHACFHAALGDMTPRLVPLRDVAQLLFNGDLDLGRVRRLSASWRADAVVARAVTLAWDNLRLSVDTELCEWARRYRPQPWEAKAMRLYTDPRRSEAARSLATLRFVPGTTGKLAYLRAVAFPSSSYLEARQRGRLGHWRLARLPWRRRSRAR